MVWLPGLQVSRKLPSESHMASQTGFSREAQGPTRCCQPLAAARSQSCLSWPSWGRMNSGGNGSSSVLPRATMLAPNMAWYFRMLPSASFCVEQFEHPISAEDMHSIPSSATSSLPSSQRSASRFLRYGSDLGDIFRSRPQEPAGGEPRPEVSRACPLLPNILQRCRTSVDFGISGAQLTAQPTRLCSMAAQVGRFARGSIDTLYQ